MTLSERVAGSMFGWIVAVSLASHAVVIAWLPSAQRHASAPPPPPVFMEMLAPPEPPPPPKPEPEPEPVTEPVLAPAAPVAAVPRAAAAPRSDAPPSTNPEPAGPVDFTSTVFSNDGAGMAIGGSGGTGAGPAPVATARPAAPAVRIVDAKSLAKKPRAPGLDAELERQYPPEARRSGISGSAVLRVRILPDGRIGPVRVVSSSWNGFGPACERTVRAARWEPPIDHDGSAVTTEITYTCRFEVRS